MLQWCMTRWVWTYRNKWALALEFFFSLGCLLSLLHVGSKATWQGYLTAPPKKVVWTLDLGTSPLWNPPVLPTYATFHKTFVPDIPDAAVVMGREDFPSENEKGIKIIKSPKIDTLLLTFLLHLLPLCFFIGIISKGLALEVESFLLYQVQYAGAGLTLGGLLFFVFWYAPEFPLCVGLIIGLFIGWRKSG